ncbi:MAG: YggT family protein [Propionibacteriaceae bacterium]|nr:YggT family protein [Propionibacteriaceae bacterium]
MTIGWVLFFLLTVYQWVLVGRAILSWVQIINPQWTPKGILLLLAEALYTLTDPPLRFLRKFIKPLRVSGIGLDMAFLVLFLLVILGLYVVQAVFF